MKKTVKYAAWAAVGIIVVLSVVNAPNHDFEEKVVALVVAAAFGIAMIVVDFRKPS